MTFEEIDVLVRSANPVPDPSALEPIDVHESNGHQRKRATMQIQDLTETTTVVHRRPSGGRNGKTIAGVAAALLVVVALVTVSAVTGDDDGTDVPASRAASPIDLADSFLAEWASYDSAEVASYLSTDALAAAGGLDAIDREVRWREASGWQWMFEGCAEVGAGTARTILRCPFSYHGIRSDELGLPPFEGSDYRIVVGSGGQIESFTENIEFEANQFSARVWEPFHDWVRANHPDDVDVMYTDATGSSFGDTDESIALWERRSREYVEATR